MLTMTATNARAHFFEILKNTTQAHKTYQIQTRTGSVVMMSGDEYENLIETMELLKIPRFRESISRSLKQVEKGQTYSMKEIFGEE